MERALLLCNGEEIQPNHLLMSSQLGKTTINEDLAAIKNLTSNSTAVNVGDATTTNTEPQISTENEGLGIEVGMSMKEAEKAYEKAKLEARKDKMERKGKKEPCMHLGQYQ